MSHKALSHSLYPSVSDPAVFFWVSVGQGGHGSWEYCQMESFQLILSSSSFLEVVGQGGHGSWESCQMDLSFCWTSSFQKSSSFSVFSFSQFCQRRFDSEMRVRLFLGGSCFILTSLNSSLKNSGETSQSGEHIRSRFLSLLQLEAVCFYVTLKPLISWRYRVNSSFQKGGLSGFMNVFRSGKVA